MSSFKAILVEKSGETQSAANKDISDSDLMDGDVTDRVEYTSINYKAGLAAIFAAEG